MYPLTLKVLEDKMSQSMPTSIEQHALSRVENTTTSAVQSSLVDCKSTEEKGMQTIVKLHRAVIKVIGLEYPDLLQNQLLTISRAVGALTEWQEANPLVLTESESAVALQAAVDDFKSTVTEICDAMPTVDLNVTTWKAHLESQEKKVYEAGVPLLDFFKAMNWFVYIVNLRAWTN
jgi:hypothetical protein